MQLDNTVIIPSDDADLAQKLFDSLVYQEDCLLVVILGDTDESKQAVTFADKRANVVVEGFTRKVAWVRDINSLSSRITAIKDGNGSLTGKDLSQVLGFSVSLANTVADVMNISEEITFLRLEQLFLSAGL